MKLKEITNILLVFVLISLSTTGTAQVYNLKSYTQDEGLPQSYIYSISQAGNGFLYIATGEGFCTFDGYKFKTYTVKDGLSENFVTTHFTDSRGHIWLGHFQHGITILKGKKFQVLKGSETIKARITAFAEDREKNIWVATRGKGIFRIDTLMNLSHVIAPHAYVSSICFDSKGYLLAGTNEGLVIINPGKTKQQGFISYFPGLENKNVQAIFPAGMGRDSFWVAVQDEGIYGVRYNGARPEIFITVSSSELNVSQTNISAVFVDSDKALWVGLTDDGVRKISFTDTEVKNKADIISIKKENGLSNQSIQSIYQDNEGNMWLGTFGGGLVQIPEDRFSCFNNKTGLAENEVYAVLIDRKGNTWLGNKSGLNLFRKCKNDECIQYNSSNGFITDKVNALIEDDKGMIWIGTSENGVYTFDPSRKKFENFSRKHSLRFLSTNTLAKSRNGIIIIGTTEGAYFYDPSSQKTTIVTTSEGLLHNNVNHVFVDSRNRAWFSSHGAPPYYIDRGEATAFKNIPGLTGFNINAVTEDRNGNIWIATEGDGIFRYDGKTFTNFTIENKLLSNFCYSVVCDNNNNTIWIGHKNGLSSITNNARVFRTLTKADGLICSENNMNAGFSAGDKVCFGTSSGIVIYDSNKDKVPAKEPRTSLIAVTVNAQLYQPDAKIDLPYGHYSIRFDYIGVSFSGSDKVLYKYRLLGLDTTWRITNDCFIEFPKLPDGQYTFQVLAANKEGRWNAVPAQAQLSIDIPFWKATWFYVTLTIVIIAMAYAVIIWRTRSLRKKNLELEQSVTEKTHELNREKELVKQIQKINQELDRFVYSASHDLRAPLSSIMGLINVMKYNSSPEVLQRNLDMMQKCVEKLDIFIIDIINYSRNSRTEVRQEKVNFYEIINSILDHLKFIESAEKIRFDVDIREEAPFFSDMHRIKVIFNNFLSNSIKYADFNKPQPFTSIQIHSAPEAVTICIEDNGQGIEEQFIDRIFDMFFRASENSVGSGLGLYIVKEILEKLNGSINVRSEINKGTQFIIKIPNNPGKKVQLISGHEQVAVLR